MAGIRVNTPKGPGWTYSLDNLTWQSSRVFMNKPDGSPFVSGEIYPVYCRNEDQQLQAQASIVFGLPTSEDRVPVSLDGALQNGANSQIVPLFEGGLAAILPAQPAGVNYPEVIVGPDGTFYYRGVETPGLTVVSVDELYSLVADTVESLPDYILRLDRNDCGATPQLGGEIEGWVADLTHLDSPAQVRIEKDGSIIGTVTASLPRPDVRTYLATLGHFTTNELFGYKLAKPVSASDGKEHDWQIYGGNTMVKAISDLGAPNKITCGTAATLPPTLEHEQPDVLVSLTGDYSFKLVANQFASANSGDRITRTPYFLDGGTQTTSALPLGISYDPATEYVTVAASFANRAFAVRTIGVNKYNQAKWDDWLLTIDRAVLPACPNYFALTDAQLNALPIVAIQEYHDPSVPMGSIPYTVRPYASRAEAVLHIGITGSKNKFDFNRATTAGCAIGDTLYNDDRPEHILDQSSPYWPVEAGFWGVNLVLPAGGNNGSYVLLQTNACGIITSRETITLIAN